jgi:hypothetical protein
MSRPALEKGEPFTERQKQFGEGGVLQDSPTKTVAFLLFQ